jgi:hypothetical protein
MTFCAETGGSSGSGVDNTGAFGFLTFGGTVVNFTSTITSQSNSSVYAGGDYYVFPGTIAINSVFPTATGLIGFIDATPPPPASAFDWFLCNDDPSCGTLGVVCHQMMMEVTSMPDSIMLIGVEGAFDTVNDLISALGGNTGCPDLTVHPLPCGVPMPVELGLFRGAYLQNEVCLEWSTITEFNADYFFIERSLDGNSWTNIASVTAAGFSEKKLDYAIRDPFIPEVSSLYYRLKQVDFDGVVNDYGSISVKCSYRDHESALRFNLLGFEVDEEYKGFVILLFEDGSTIKTFQYGL